MAETMNQGFTHESEPIEAPSCMECMGCTDCSCKTADVLTTRTYKQLDDKLRVFIDLVCVVMNAHCLDLPRILGKFIYMLWCFLTDLVHQIRCLHSRTDILHKRDEELCEKTQVIAYNHNNNNRSIKALTDYVNHLYDVQLDSYNRQVKEVQSKSTLPGYLQSPQIKNLYLEHEANATLTATGRRVPDDVFNSLPHAPSNTVYTDPRSLRYSDYPVVTSTTQRSIQRFILRVGDSVTATYTNLERSSFSGSPIDSIKYTFKLTKLEGMAHMCLSMLEDPATTSFMHAWDSKGDQETPFEFEVNVSIFSEGVEIIPTPDRPLTLLFSSLNSVGGKGEYVSKFNGEFIPINGSAITERSGKVTNYSDKPIDQFARDAGSTTGEWDASDNEYNWVGAIAGKATHPVKFSIGTTNAFWFAFNTGVNVPTLPLKPLPPSSLVFTDINLSCGDLSEFTCGERKVVTEHSSNTY